MNIGLEAARGCDSKLIEKLREEIAGNDSIYPEYTLSLTPDMKMVCTFEELRNVLSDAIENDGFSVLYLGKIGEGAKLTKRDIRDPNPKCIAVPPLFKKEKLELNDNRAIVKHQKKDEGIGKIFIAAAIFFFFGFLAVMMVKSRRYKKY